MQRNFAAQTGFIIFGLGHCDQRARLFHPVAPRGFFEKGNAQPRWKRDGSRRILAACQTSLPRVRTIQAKNPSKGGTMRAALPREGGIADQHDKRKQPSEICKLTSQRGIRPSGYRRELRLITI